MDNSNLQFNIFDLFCFIIIVAVIIIFTIQPALINPQLDDITYHFMVAENYQKAGGVSTWDFWESLPDGRPQLYPPLVHVIISAIIKLPFSIGQLLLPTALFFIAITLLLGWWGTKMVFDSKVAFFSLLILTSSSQYLTLLGTIIPASLVVAAIPLLFFFVLKNKIAAPTIFLSLLFYTHMVMPWLIVGGLFVWAIINKNYFKNIAKTVCFAIILYLPWLINIILHLNYIKYLDSAYNQAETIWHIAISIPVLILLICGLIYLLVTGKKVFFKKNGFFLIIWLLALPILFSQFPNRFILSIGFFLAAIIIGSALGNIYNKADYGWLRLLIIIVVIALNFGCWQLNYSQNARLAMSWKNGLIWQDIKLNKDPNLQWITQRYAYNKKTAQEVINIINNNSSSLDPIYSLTSQFNAIIYPNNYDHLIAQLFTALANRPSANLRMPEVFWQNSLPLEKNKIVLADLDQDNQLSESQQNILQKNFTIIGKVNRLTIFKNNSDNTFQIQPPKNVIPLWLTYALLILALMLIGRENYEINKQTNQE